MTSYNTSNVITVQSAGTVNEAFGTDTTLVRIGVKDPNTKKISYRYSAGKFGDTWVVRNNRKADALKVSADEAAKILKGKMSALLNLKKVPADQIVLVSAVRDIKPRKNAKSV